MQSVEKSGGLLRLAALLTLLCGCLWLAVGQAPPPNQAPAGTLRVTTRLILVDAVVVDKQGHAVSDLKQEDFALTENGKQQHIATFSLQRADLARAAVRPAPLPPNLYTNRPEYRTPPGPLTMLLLDSLNTPLADQAYARLQMLKYLQTQLQPGQGTAVLALGSSLRLLQDFTSDPQLLRAAVQKFTAGKSVLLTDANDELNLAQPNPGGAVRSQSSSSGAAARMAQQLQAFEDEQNAAQTDIRVQITLAALRSIARTAAGFPGRKVLIWVSGAFPLNLQPDQFSTGILRNVPGLGQSRYYAGQVQSVAALLADAQVAIYPVDARGLSGLGMPDASQRSQQQGRSRTPGGISFQNTDLIDSHFTMEQLAEDTGGRALFNRNDIDQAVALAATEGATYYELGFYPEGNTWDGKYHKLTVKVVRPAVDVRYRRGYFATDPLRWSESGQKPDLDIREALLGPVPATQITFVARVVPQTTGAQSHIDIQFSADAATISFEEEPDGRRHASLDFLAVAVTPDGKSAAQDSKIIDTHLLPETFAQVQKGGLPFHMELQVAAGNYQLHLGVRDKRTGWIGTTTVPLLLATPGAPKP
jgi:VWFA-related protein